jgi:uncharacterized protein (UPF0264 family)
MTDFADRETGFTRLLISVRNAAEALLALRAGVTLLDIKEPLHGPLGAASPAVWQAVQAVIEEHLAEEQVTVSAALGELLDYQEQPLPPEFSLVKFGLAGCGPLDDWPHRWRKAIGSLPAGVQPVAVIYADYERAAAPRPAEVIAVGRELGCRYVLVDTFDKSHGGLLDLWPWLEIQRLVQQVQGQGLRMVLAGSLSVSCIRRLLPLRPAVVGVRGAACGGDRNGGLSAACVKELVSLAQGASPAKAAYAMGALP